MKIGFTGTRIGLTAAQALALEEYLRVRFLPEQAWAIHGDCIGADAAFDSICSKLGIRRGVYPSDVEVTRARCDRRGATVMHAPAAPKRRNVWIVKSSDILIACPKNGREEQRSGTWHAVRVAWTSGKRVDVVWPDGKIETDVVRSSMDERR